MMNADKKKQFPQPKTIKSVASNQKSLRECFCFSQSTPRLPQGCTPKANWGAKLNPMALLCA